MRRNLDQVRERETTQSPEELREQELLQISIDSYKYMLNIRSVDEEPDPLRIQNVLTAQKMFDREPKFNYFDASDPEHAMARDDGLAFALTSPALASAIWHPSHEEFFRKWRFRS